MLAVQRDPILRNQELGWRGEGQERVGFNIPPPPHAPITWGYWLVGRLQRHVYLSQTLAIH